MDTIINDDFWEKDWNKKFITIFPVSLGYLWDFSSL
jgi:hypothetical protein